LNNQDNEFTDFVGLLAYIQRVTAVPYKTTAKREKILVE
jgi:hypothetical protein